MRYLLGIDIGSYSSKGVLLDETGAIVSQAQRKHTMHIPGPGLAEHDAEQDWWGAFCHLSQQLLQQSGIHPAQVAAVGCSGIGPCVLPLDAAGKPLRRAILYGIDTRAEAEIAELNAALGEDAILQRCGNALSTQAVGPKIRWLQKNEPEVWAKTTQLVGCPTFIVQRLTGRAVVDHYSAASYTPCYDLANGGWHQETVASLCPPQWLPEIGWSGDVAGYVTAPAAALTGLLAGTPVIIGTIDAATEALSVGVAKPGDLMVMYGTTVFFIQVNAQRRVDARYWSAPFLFPDTWCVMGGLATAGALTHWFREQIVGMPDDDQTFDALTRLAAGSLAGANGLLVLPYFSGERTPINDPHAKGMIFGLTLAHSRADLYRALLEGIGHAIRHNLDTFAEAGPAKAVYAVGGGVKNTTWLQIACDIANVSQHIRRETIGAALGSAFLAGVGCGMFRREDIGCINPLSHTVHPQASVQEGYDAAHQRYRLLYQRTRDLMV